uniref:Signal peptide peptidase n=1 Tax=Chromulina nebulosa TaxID=96789 RepID=A0A7S0SXT6_9STRA|mmetsp:Transcript_3992/g.3584  ORF Transcript_3992/g.3584 Transcript_3992/m.3584 type:complete len:369 (+) Transcript_3992:24-1130(+)
MSQPSNQLLSYSYIALFSIWSISYFIAIPVSINLIITSTLIIYIGSHRSLRLLISEADGGIPKSEKEVMTEKDVYKFPIVGSLALFSLYIAFKYFNKDIVNLILSLYFSVIGVFTLTGTFAPFLSPYIPHDKTKKYGFKTSVVYFGEIDALLTIPEVISFILSIIFAVYYFRTKHYMLNNVLGISFCIQSIERISIGSYKIGAILLVGLFFYDIFWVFGTDVMVTVAKSFDGPIKILFPIIIPTATEKGKFSLLGLGDIVIPGLFVSLLLRFDAVRANILPKEAEYGIFHKYYFHFNLLFYSIGLVVTVSVMYFFNAAQPALLYLVPACLGSSLFVGFARNELAILFAYDEEHKDKKATENIENKKEK